MATSCTRKSRLALGSCADMPRCQALQMVKYYKGQHIIHLTDAVIEQHHKTIAKTRQSINSERLRWKPCVAPNGCLCGPC